MAHALDPRFKDTILVGQEAVDFRAHVAEWIGEHLDDEEEDDLANAVAHLSSPVKKKSHLGKRPVSCGAELQLNL